MSWIIERNGIVDAPCRAGKLEKNHLRNLIYKMLGSQMPLMMHER